MPSAPSGYCGWDDGQHDRALGEGVHLSLGEPEPDVVDGGGDGLPRQVGGMVRLGDRGHDIGTPWSADAELDCPFDPDQLGQPLP